VPPTNDGKRVQADERLNQSVKKKISEPQLPPEYGNKVGGRESVPRKLGRGRRGEAYIYYYQQDVLISRHNFSKPGAR
jgi:plasmid stabilization system protein ParE